LAVDPAIRLAHGTKRLCATCEVRFYDLGRSPIVCPTCGAEHVPIKRWAAEPLARSTWGGQRPRPIPVVPETIASEVPAEIEIKDEAEDAETDALPEEELLLEETDEDLDEAAALIEPEAEAGEKGR
jgi:uncharacterized protein (TIGR02300 family)